MLCIYMVLLDNSQNLYGAVGYRDAKLGSIYNSILFEIKLIYFLKFAVDISLMKIIIWMIKV